MKAIKRIEKLKGETTKTQKNLYFDKDIVDRFEAACRPLSVSKALQVLMEEYLEESETIKKKTTKKATRKKAN